jgi:hypothetical protein
MKKKPIVIHQNSTSLVPGVTKNIIRKFKKLAGINFNAQITEIKKIKITHYKFIPFFKKNSEIIHKEKDISFLKKIKSFQSKKHIK